MDSVHLGGKLCGKIAAIPSKSMAHRVIICAALAGGGTIYNFCNNDDTEATINCLTSLNVATFYQQQSTLHVFCTNKLPSNNASLFCNESGTTLRIMLAIAPLFANKVNYYASGNLLTRPLDPLLKQLATHGLKISHPLKTFGAYSAGEFELPGNVSTQFITALLLALPLLPANSTLKILPPLEGKGYVDLTVSVMKKFGVYLNYNDGKYKIDGNQRYAPAKITLEGDYSNAAFFLVAGILGNGVTVFGLDPKSLQGDKNIISALQKMGATINAFGDCVTAKKSNLQAVQLDVSSIIDLVPILAVAACFASGTSRFLNVKRLKYKESDRLNAIVDELKKLGAIISCTENEIEITGAQLKPSEVFSHNDHRIAMALAVASTACGGLILRGASCVKKSAPSFFEQFALLGGKIIEQ